MEKETRVCVNCGAEFIPTRNDQKYCRRICGKRFIAREAKRAKKRELPAKFTCQYNDAIICDKPNCESCGWNPEVAKRRSCQLQSKEAKA